MTKPKNFPALATAAAAWWRAALAGEPTSPAQPRPLVRLSTTRTPSPAVLDAFQAELLARIQDLPARYPAAMLDADYWPGRIELECDYGPETLLAVAAHATGVNGVTFPWKTSTYIDTRGFWVSAGYGADHVLNLAATHN